jgi:hypothetical protein
MMDAMLQLSAVTMKTVQWLQSARSRMEYQSAKVMSIIVLRCNTRGGRVVLMNIMNLSY